MNIDTLLADKPKFHRDRDGNPISYAISRGLAHYLDKHLAPGMRSLETGSGYSTVIFAYHDTNHTIVAPNQLEAESIAEYCASRQVSTSGLHFKIGRSEDLLPRLDLGVLDLILIDGRHGFPAPFIDWYYTVGALKIGGVLIVDDTQLWTGQILHQFLSEDPAWSLVAEVDEKTSIFHKLSEHSHNREWNHQPFVEKRSRKAGEPRSAPKDSAKGIWRFFSRGDS